MKNSLRLFLILFMVAIALSGTAQSLITDDPTAKVTDVYAFRSPDDTNTVTIIANYIPFEIPATGADYHTFSETVRYEVHIENDGIAGDDITYRFTFTKVNDDPTTIFRVRLGQQNYKTSYICEKSIHGGPFNTIVSNGIVPTPNIGLRSITNPTVGLGASGYNDLMNAAVATATGGGGEVIFCGPADDPFFANMGGFNDIANAGPNGVITMGNAHKNIHSIALKIPIATLQKNGQSVNDAVNMLDGNYVIGVWASASRQQTRTLNNDGTETYSGSWVQVSRAGMPLLNKMIIPIGMLNPWNTLTPYTENPAMEDYFCNPEMGLYMDASIFGNAIPAMSQLRIQRNSLQAFDFGNTHDGLYPLLATNAGAGTALDVNLFGNYLLRQGKPRSVDLLPIYHTGLPNLSPYQLATGKNGNPLANGKPFINNFLPTFGDMLRLNMAVPVTPRNSSNFSSLGLVKAMALGITAAPYNTNANLEWIPNMDGFPNGRRLEDDVMGISLQLTSGILLADIGLWYDDYTAGGPNPITLNYLNTLSYSTGVEANDTTFNPAFPYVQTPWAGDASEGNFMVTNITHYDTSHVTINDTAVVTVTDTNYISVSVTDTLIISTPLGLNPPDNINILKMYPNPAHNHVVVDNGNFAIMSAYKLEIRNVLSQVMFSHLVDQQIFDIDLATWGAGTYTLQIIDGSNATVLVKKLIIQ